MVKKFNFSLIILLIVILAFSLTALAQKEDKGNLYQDKEFRNPFLEYKEPEPVPKPNNNNTDSSENTGTTAAQAQATQKPVITFEMVRDGLPFNLGGIISSQKERIVLLNTGEGTEFIRGYYKKNGYELIDIHRDSIIVRNRGFRLRLEIGGEIDEI